MVSRLKRAGRFLRLPFRKKRLLLRTALLLGMIRLGLILLPFGRLQRFLARFADVDVEPATVDSHDFETTVWAVEAVGRTMPGASNCLTQALTGHVLLARNGYRTDLRIGAGKDPDGKFIAHAWLEKDGQVVLGRIGHKHDGYTPLEPFRKPELFH